MKYTIFVVAFAAVVAAQSESDLPACAVTCALQNTGVSGCSNPTDIACLCASTAYQTAYAQCLGSTCNSTEAATATQIGIALCQQNGVSVTPLSSTSTATNAAQSSAISSNATAAASSAISANSTAASIISSALSSAASSVSASMSSMSKSLSSAASSHSASAASAASSASASAASETSKAAAPTSGLVFGMLGLGAAAAAALL